MKLLCFAVLWPNVTFSHKTNPNQYYDALTRSVGKLPVQRCCFNGANVGGIVMMIMVIGIVMMMIMMVVRIIMIVTKSWMTRMMTVPLRWTVSSMWPEGRMTLLGLTRSSMMMPI